MPPSLLNFDIWLMHAVALACLPVFVTDREIARREGAVFLLCYAAHGANLNLAAQQHDALGVFSGAMLGVVIAITVVKRAVAMLPSARPGRSPRRAALRVAAGLAAAAPWTARAGAAPPWPAGWPISAR